MMRKLLSLILILAIVFSLALPVSAETVDLDALRSAIPGFQKLEPTAAYEPPIPMRVFGVSYPNDIAGGHESSIWLDLYRKYLGVDLQYEWVVVNTQYENRVNIAIASGEIPDVMPVNYTQLHQLVDAGLLADLTEAWDSGASSLTKDMYKRGFADTSFEIATVDGKLYGIPAVTPIPETTRALYLRNDWMKTLGLSAPQTREELISVLEAFATKDPDGNGANDTYALSLFNELWGGHCNDLTAFSNAFGAYPDIWIDTPSGIEFGGIQPEMKEVLAQLAYWYQKGYISSDFTMMDFDMAEDEIARGRVGATFGTHIAMLNGGRTLFKNDSKFEIGVYPIPGVGKDKLPASAYDNTNTFYVVNAKYEHPEAIVKLLNLVHWFSSSSPVGCGPDDMDYDYWSDYIWMGEPQAWSLGFVRPETIHNNIERVMLVKKAIESGASDDIEAATSAYLGRVLYNNWSIYKTEGEAMRQSEDAAVRDEVSWFWLQGLTSGLYEIALDIYQDNLMIDRKGSIVTNSMVDYMSTLDALQLTYYTNIITGQEPIDSFDTFVEQWKAMGGQTITEELNAHYAEN